MELHYRLTFKVSGLGSFYYLVYCSGSCVRAVSAAKCPCPASSAHSFGNINIWINSHHSLVSTLCLHRLILIVIICTFKEHPRNLTKKTDSQTQMSSSFLSSPGPSPSPSPCPNRPPSRIKVPKKRKKEGFGLTLKSHEPVSEVSVRCPKFRNYDVSASTKQKRGVISQK